MLASVQQCHRVATRREKLWVLFHQFSLDNGIGMCITCDQTLHLSASETFWQLFMEKEFLKTLTLSEQSHSSTSSPSVETSDRRLSVVEENAVRYTAGYVVRKLESKYSGMKTQESIECLRALREMGGKLMSREKESVSQWSKLADRGGLYHVGDAAFELFVALEHVVDDQLTSIFKRKGKGLKMVKKEKLQWVCNSARILLITYDYASISIYIGHNILFLRQKLLVLLSFSKLNILSFWITRTYSKIVYFA